MAHSSDYRRWPEPATGVGACKVSSCSFNEDLECTAESITVGLVDKYVECLTYMMR
jgi:hypothetical protein